MSACSPADNRRNRDRAGRSRRWARRLASRAWEPGALLLLGLIVGAGVAEGANFCQDTAQRTERSCQAGGQSDYWLGVAKCTNTPDSAARNECLRQVSAARKDSVSTCTAQLGARRDACARLGGSAYDPVIDPANFVAKVDNPYFPLKPGTTFIYEGSTADGFEHNEFAVTHNTRVILGVTCVEIRDTVTLNGKLIEDTLDWFAQDKEGNVWYFGENSKQLAGGLIVGLEGSWTAGVDGAKPGIIMKAQPAVGDFYRQEFAIATAEDLAEVLSLTESVSVPYGSFTGCLKTRETSPLEPDAAEAKFYCRGVGQVLTVDLTNGDQVKLVKIVTK